MINWAKWFWIWATARFRPPMNSVLDEAHLNLRVGFFDADISYANNSSFLRLMEFGRLDLMARTGFLKHVIKNKWSLPLASVHVLYRRPVKRWQKVLLKTQVVSWQDEWIFVAQTMESNGKVVLRAVIKSALLEKGKKKNFVQILEQVGLPSVSPEPSKEIGPYLEMDRLLREEPTGY